MKCIDELKGNKVQEVIEENGIFLNLENDGNVAIFSDYILKGCNGPKDLMNEKLEKAEHVDDSFVFYFSNLKSIWVNVKDEALSGPEILSLRSGTNTLTFYPQDFE